MSPEGQRLVFTAARNSWPGQRTSRISPLPAYLHWRQWRRLDEVMALSLAQGNAPELLALARQFQVEQFWYGRRGPAGPALYELINLLGDEKRSPRSLEWGHPPQALGSMELALRPLGAGRLALLLSYQGRVVVVVPPGTRGQAAGLAGLPGMRVAALIIPGNAARALDAWSAAVRPEIIAVYGAAPGIITAAARPSGVRSYYTQEGAVSLKISTQGATVRQWRP